MMSSTKYASGPEISTLVQQSAYQFENHGQHFLQHEEPYYGTTFIAVVGRIALEKIPELSNYDACCISLIKPEDIGADFMRDYNMAFDFTEYENGNVEKASSFFLSKNGEAYAVDSSNSERALNTIQDDPAAALESLIVAAAEQHVARLVPDPTKGDELTEIDAGQIAISVTQLSAFRRLVSVAVYS